MIYPVLGRREYRLLSAVSAVPDAVEMIFISIASVPVAAVTGRILRCR
jgi:hypothetical protein